MSVDAVGPRLLVLYDADCGLCTHSARLLRRLDPGGRLQLVPLRAVTGIPGAPPVEALIQALHVRAPDGRWSAGGAACLEISREIALLRPFGRLARLPVVRRLVEPTYARIAANRLRISRLLRLDACRVDGGTS